MKKYFQKHIKLNLSVLALLIASVAYFGFAKDDDFMSKTHLTKVDEQNFNEFINTKDKLVIVEFNAKWCPTCKKMAPVLNDLSETYAGNTIFGSVDIDDNANKTREYNIDAIPAMLFFKNGELKGRVVGLTAKEDLAKLIQEQKN